MSSIYRWLVCVGVLLVHIHGASADPLRFLFTSRVTYPEKPQLSITALEPVQDLSVDMAPTGPGQGQASGESAPQKAGKANLKPGEKLQIAIGEGKAGSSKWKAQIKCRTSDGKEWAKEANFETLVIRKLVISYDPKNPSPHLDLEQRFVEVRISEPAGSAEILVNSDDGSEMGKGSATFHGEPPQTWLRIPWEGQALGNSDSVVLRLAITIHSNNGATGKIDLYPWSVTVAHREVNFDTGSAEIGAAERSKLDESFGKLNSVLSRVERTLQQFAEKGIVTTAPPKIQLYVAGHTDTVGGDGANLALSKNRARAIATYFRQKGFGMPIFYAGFGQRQLRVKTDDNVEESRNRRADYTLALRVPPVLPNISWQKL
jgi:outer membrane protein OmpA-like peptidoglycan-associated protein